MAIDGEQSHKSHRSCQSGPTAKKKSKSDKKIKGASDENNKQHNPKAFAFNSMAKAKKMQARATEKEQKRFHVPTVDRPTGEPAPHVIVVQGPPKVGKSLLIKSLVKHYTKQNLPEVRGPITIVSVLHKQDIPPKSVGTWYTVSAWFGVRVICCGCDAVTDSDM